MFPKQMGYRLIQDETLPRGLKRIARDEIDSAIAQLCEKDPSKLDYAIHEARKSIKKLRGLMRMLSPVLGPPARVDIEALGHVGRTLSEVRDAAALVEAVDLLSHHTRNAQCLKELAALRAGMLKRGRDTIERSEVRIVCEQAIIQLRHLKRGLATWKLEDSFDTIAPGLKKSLKRGRKALRLAGEFPDPENFHGLRKRVKDRWYQVRILESLWSPPAISPEKALRDLQEDLGDDHNLHVLRSFIPAESAALLRVLDRTQKALRRKSMAAAAALCEQKAGDTVRELKGLWDEWRPQPKSVKSSRSTNKGARSAA
jgi:CHAD domain-containing protein